MEDSEIQPNTRALILELNKRVADTDEGENTIAITVRLPKGSLERLDTLAKIYNISRAELARKMLRASMTDIDNAVVDVEKETVYDRSELNLAPLSDLSRLAIEDRS